MFGSLRETDVETLANFIMQQYRCGSKAGYFLSMLTKNPRVKHEIERSCDCFDGGFCDACTYLGKAESIFDIVRNDENLCRAVQIAMKNCSPRCSTFCKYGIREKHVVAQHFSRCCALRGCPNFRTHGAHQHDGERVVKFVLLPVPKSRLISLVCREIEPDDDEKIFFRACEKIRDAENAHERDLDAVMLERDLRSRVAEECEARDKIVNEESENFVLLQKEFDKLALIVSANRGKPSFADMLKKHK